MTKVWKNKSFLHLCPKPTLRNYQGTQATNLNLKHSISMWANQNNKLKNNYTTPLQSLRDDPVSLPTVSFIRPFVTGRIYYLRPHVDVIIFFPVFNNFPTPHVRTYQFQIRIRFVREP